MQPILFHVGDHEVGAYTAALTLAFALGIAVAHRRAARQGLDPHVVVDVSMLIIVAALVGSRLAWVAMRPDDVGWLAALHPFAGQAERGYVGLTVTGGLPAATIAALAFFAWRRLPVLAYADLLAPSVMLGAAVTRIGCFLNGCCHGRVCDLPWAVAFPAGSLPDLAFPGQPVHPTQLYASLAAALAFVFLLGLARRSPPAGVVFFAMLALTGATRIAIEFLRHNDAAEIAGVFAGLPLSVYQLTSAGILAVGALGCFASLRVRTLRQPA